MKSKSLDFTKQKHRIVVVVLGVCGTFASVGTLLSQSQDDALAVQLEKKSLNLSYEWRRDSFEKALEALIDAAKLRTASGNSTATISCLRSAARLEISLGRKESAQTLLQTALATAEKNPTLEIEQSKLFSQLSTFYLHYGNEKKSAEYLRKATQIADRIVDNNADGEVAFSTGIYHYAKSDVFVAIEKFSESALRFRESANSQRETDAYLELGYAFLKSTDYESSLRSFQMAMDLSVKNSDLRRQTFSHQGIGKTFIAMSQYGRAFDQFKKAESLFTEGLDYSAKGSLMNALSELNEKYSNIELALDYRVRAYELFKKDGHLYGQLSSISDLARLHAINGNDDAAEDCLSDGENLARKINDEFHLARIYEQKGNLFFLRSENQIARAYLEKAIALFQRKKAMRPLNRVKQELGMIDIKTDRFRSGRSLLDEAYVFSRKIDDKYAQSEILLEFGKLSQLENKKIALDYTKQSIELSDALYSDVSNSKLQSLYFSGAIGRYEFYLYLLMQQHKELPDDKNEILSLQATERSRSRMLLERLWLLNATLLKDASAEMVTQEKDVRIALNSKTDQMASMLSSNATSSKTVGLAAEIRDLENQLEEIRAELKQSSPIYSAIKNPEPFDVEDFQKNVLGEDDLLLEFSLGKEESYLWAVDKQDVTAYYLPSREQIEARVEKLRGLLWSRRWKQGDTFEEYHGRVADAEIEYKAEARILSSELLGQVAADKLAGKRLIVVADGRLHYFPLGSLPMPNSESDDPILLNQEVVYEPSASALKIFKMEKKAEARPQKDLLVFADPVFSKSDERIAGLDTSNQGFVATVLSTFRSIESLESMPRLPASEAEAKSISDVVGANQTTLRAGFAANRDGVLSGGIEDYKILHFATHGLIDEKRPELSGILLSLFNDEGKRRDGGFIRLQDVYGLRLNSDLVVLSACDTGIGKEIKGEGVMSLNNAFLQAGAKSVVSSLWKVDDTAAKELMTEFYRGMADDNLTAAAALRQAQIKMYNDPRYRSPFYWAAFTASGDAGVRVAFTSYQWLYALIATAAIAASILAFLAFRRHRRRTLRRPARQ